MLFEESVFIFQFLNNKMHKCVKQNIIVHFIIQKLKNKHTFLKTEKAKFSQRENLGFILSKGRLLAHYIHYVILQVVILYVRTKRRLTWFVILILRNLVCFSQLE